MQSDRLIINQPITYPRTKSQVKSSKIYSFLLIIILCLILYFVYYTKVNDIYGKAPTTYFHFMYNRTLGDYNANQIEGGTHPDLVQDSSNNEITEDYMSTEANTNKDSRNVSSEEETTSEKQQSTVLTTETSAEKIQTTSTQVGTTSTQVGTTSTQVGTTSTQVGTTSTQVGTTSTQVDTTSSNDEKSTAAVEKENSNSNEDDSQEEISTTKIEETSTTEISSTSKESSAESKEESTETVQTSTPENIETTTAGPQVIKRLNGNITCKLPILQPFDDAVKDIWKAEDNNPPAECHVKYPEVFKSSLNSRLIKLKNATDWKDCCYIKITRPNEFSDGVDDHSIEVGKCIPIRDRITRMPNDTELIAIKCSIPDSQKKALNTTDDKRTIDAFAFIPIKEKVEKRISSILPQANPNDQVNLVIFGIDAVSHMNFMRIMPKVYSYITQNLSAIGMNGYVKIGDNTFPNLLAALAGKTVSEGEESCIKDKFFDDCPFVWKEYAARGYRTAYSEDSPWLSTFNYVKRGFRNPPADYYPRPLSLLSDKTLGNDHRGNTNLCYGPRLAIEFLLDHLKKVAFAMKPGNRRYFHFTWCTSLTHDYLTLGNQGEDALLQTLKWFHSGNQLNNTVFVLMSDHGMRYGDFRNTRQGKIEENLPFVYFMFPSWFREKYSRAIENMKGNNFRLTTPFDLHQTFLDLVDLKKIENREIESREEDLKSKRLDGKLPRGISFFLPSPIDRSCGMAGIPEHFCACHESEILPENHFLALQATNFAIYQINALVSVHLQCSFLSLSKVNRAHRFFSEVESYKNASVVLEGVKTFFKVKPGDGKFDATVLRINGTTNWTLSDISRVNLYGNQSHCVHSANMKKYCFCADLLPTEESDSDDSDD